MMIMRTGFGPVGDTTSSLTADSVADTHELTGTTLCSAFHVQSFDLAMTRRGSNLGGRTWEAELDP